MKKLELTQGTLYLDGEQIPCVKSFNINHVSKNGGIAELTICMDVTIVSKEQPVSD